MIITYDINTPYIGDARTIALRRAKAEGWRSATVISTYPTGPGSFSVTLTVVK
jgi:hypothetical protein